MGGVKMHYAGVESSGTEIDFSLPEQKRGSRTLRLEPLTISAMFQTMLVSVPGTLSGQLSFSKGSEESRTWFWELAQKPTLLAPGRSLPLDGFVVTKSVDVCEIDMDERIGCWQQLRTLQVVQTPLDHAILSRNPFRHASSAFPCQPGR